MGNRIVWRNSELDQGTAEIVTDVSRAHRFRIQLISRNLTHQLNGLWMLRISLQNAAKIKSSFRIVSEFILSKSTTENRLDKQWIVRDGQAGKDNGFVVAKK